MSALLAVAIALGAGWTDEIDRLAGQRVTLAASSVGLDYAIDDIAGEGRPWVGVVVRWAPGMGSESDPGAGESQRSAVDLLLDTGAATATAPGGVYRLTGPLAQPRMAGPGYKIWVLGEVVGRDLEAHRLGVLARPQRE